MKRMQYIKIVSSPALFVTDVVCVKGWLLASHIPTCNITSMAFCFFQQKELFQNQLQLTNVESKAKSLCQIVGNAQIHQNISIA